MEEYQIPEIPDYKEGMLGLVDCLGGFLDSNYTHLHFSKHTTKKGSIGYVAPYKEDSMISLFVYEDYDKVPMVELYWQERHPSKRHVSVKCPVNNVTDYENTMAFIGGAFPVLSDNTIDHSELSNEDMDETIREILLQAGVNGGLVAVEGYRGIDDDEEEPGEGDLEYHEKEMNNGEILNKIDIALDKRDFGEVARLRSLLKEGLINSNGLKHLKEFKNF